MTLASAALLSPAAQAQAQAQAKTAAPSSAPATQGATGADTSAADGLPGDIVVSGIRARIENSQAIKRNADTFVDAVTAEDIGALPDKSVNEVLQRIPGVNISRFQSTNDPDHFSIEGSNVIIRGLTYVRSEFNGRDAFSVNTGRALGFNDVSPELLSSVVVFKNATADRIEGGIAGVVDLRTRKPLDEKRLVVAGTLENSWGDLRKKAGPGFSGLISNVWDTGIGRIGALLSYGQSNLYSQAFGSHLTDYVYRPDLSPTGQQYYVPRGGAVRTQDFDRYRSTIDASLQWESLNGAAKVTAEYIRAKARSAWTERVIEVNLDSGTNPTPSAGNPFTFGPDGVLTSGLLVNNAPNMQVFPKRQREQSTMTEDMSLNAELHLTERLKLVLDAQYVKANADDLDVSVYGAATPLYAKVGGMNGGVPDIQYVDASGNPSTLMNNPANYYYRAAMDHIEQSDGAEKAFKADLAYDFDSSLLRAIRVGGRYTDRDQTRRYTGYNWGVVSESWAGGITPFSTGGALPVEPYLFPHFQRDNNVYPGTGFYPTMDLIAGYRDGDLQKALAAVSQSGSQAWRPLASRQGAVAGTPFLPGDVNYSRERTHTGYIRLDFGRDGVFGDNTILSGNIGLRYTGTNFMTRGFVAAPNVALQFGDANGNDPRYPGQNIPVTAANALAIAHANCGKVVAGQTAPGYCQLTDARLQQLINFSDGSYQLTNLTNRYDDFLPSLNLNLKVGPKWMFRAAVSRAMTRPDFGVTAFAATLFYTDLNEVKRNGGDVNTAPLLTTWTGSSRLTGVRSWNFDLGVEYYFQEAASVTVNAFYKDLKGILANGSNVQPFTNAAGVTMDTQVNQQVNIGSGTIKGVEIGYQQFYRKLPGLLSGLGVEANYTYVEPSSFPNQVNEARYTGLVLPLAQLSRHTVNASLIYEKGDLSMRAAYNWRSKFLLTTRDEVNPYSPIYNAPTGNLDASIFYSLSKHWKIGLYGANLLDTVTVTRQQTSYNLGSGNLSGPEAPRSYFRSDRRVTMNVRAIF